MLALSGSAAVGQAADGKTELPEARRQAGWKLLFDGVSTDQWRNFRRDSLSDGWQVQDGALVRTGKGAGDIITKDRFASFELSLEYRISKGGNSGIMFHVSEESERPWHSGPEIQVQDNVDGHDPQKSGWLYQLFQPGIDPATGEITDATRPAGEWNHVQLLVTPVGCEVNLNGYRYYRFQLNTPDWKERVAKSKFAKYPEFGSLGIGHICLQDHGNEVAYRNIMIRDLPWDGVASEPISGTLPLQVEQAFPQLEWTGWEPADERGRVQDFRPIVVTHAGDGSNRVFVATQRGVIHAFENSQDATATKVFLDLRDRVIYKSNENEEGFLGLSFHPNYRENGEFCVYYTTRKAPHTSVISTFRRSANNPDKADPESEKVLLEIEQPFWNHNGGTVAYGPDGLLYIALGDGGAANDPFGHAQNTSTLLGSILRIDTSRSEDGKPYAIPADNPLVGQKEARPEIFAWGVRNVWRMAFDRETGKLWCGDVGQNLWEEINIVEKGGNYGWNLREATHPFGRKSSDGQDLKDPVWEYDHQVGKSITGGLVYRGSRLPQLVGKYLYADYITGRIWALKYDAEAGKVVSNESIPSQKLPIITFGDDEQGDVYFTMVTANGRGLFRFAPADKKSQD
ncbi:MAG: PQQ-dependent sugar dehydrogenase [Planctomycetaceae bacterium]|nr:PQQ-dependent sugar dehydrogenase [Planctomycetaceae bacterium]